MKKALCVITGLIALPLHSLMAAEGAHFPEKDPVFTYVAPAKWKTAVNPKDGSIAINSGDGRISVNFAEVPLAASIETLEKMLPDMIKELDGAAVAKKPMEHIEDGLTGYSATDTGKIEGLGHMD
ncbi:MAG: hypothetical protein WCH40_10030 [Verrucomicrobiales bacterium]